MLWVGLQSNLTFFVVALYRIFLHRRCTWFVQNIPGYQVEEWAPVTSTSLHMPPRWHGNTNHEISWFPWLHCGSSDILSFALFNSALATSYSFLVKWCWLWAENENLRWKSLSWNLYQHLQVLGWQVWWVASRLQYVVVHKVVNVGSLDGLLVLHSPFIASRVEGKQIQTG